MFQNLRWLLVLPFLLSSLYPLLAQDTLSFGGIYDLPGAEVRAAYVPVSPLAQSFTIEEVYRLPGTFYDPARLVALLPGVVQTNDQANHLSVRGNTPNANLWRLNGLAIVNPNHTANAGTFYDFPTLSGGGVNAISAQMLDNSGFLAGGLPVEYGFATGGTFDLRLRPGSKTRRKYQAQAGFIGFDLMAEGPIGKSEQTSYLVNGRYSFTGLLADMGVDFGGEEIRFADLNAHLHHQWDGGEISAFAIVGGSSNFFAGPDPAEQEITIQKELFDIDFRSDLLITGTTFRQQTSRGVLNLGASVSAIESQRGETPNFGFFRGEDKKGVNDQVISASLSYEEQPSETQSIKLGLEFLSHDAEFTTSGVVIVGGQRIFYDTKVQAYSPYFQYSFNNERHDLQLGLRGSVFTGQDLNDFVLEPRVKYQIQGQQSSLAFSAQRVTRIPLSSILLSRRFFEGDLFTPNSNQADLRYSFQIGKIRLASSLFYQYSPREYADRDGDYLYSANNLLEINPLGGGVAIDEETATRRYGVELEAGGGRKDEGWYYRGSLTLLRAETQQRFIDNGWAKDRYSADFIGKLTVGREWSSNDKKNRPRAYGLNLALIAHGGERYGEILSPICQTCGPGQIVPQYFENGLLNSTGTYFRPDLRLYKIKTRKKTTTTLALDIQNAAGIENLGNVYYDAFLDRPNERFQLGLIPVLSYRVVWR